MNKEFREGYTKLVNKIKSAALICRFKESEEVHQFIRDLNERDYVIKTVSNMVLKEYKNSAYVEIPKPEEPET